MKYFSTEYTIHFDDTMAYGSHHFLTAFKLQCAARESFLFGEKVYDVPGVQQALDRIHLLTADAYARNLHSARLGERLAILLTIEEWHRASARFCYRVIRDDGQPICAGFQTLIGVDATSGMPIPLPDPLWQAMESMRAIEEPFSDKSFRDRVLAGGAEVEKLFGQLERDTAIAFLNERYPSPKVIGASPSQSLPPPVMTQATNSKEVRQVWVFAGQGALDIELLCQRVSAYRSIHPAAIDELNQCAQTVKQLIGGSPTALVNGIAADCRNAIEETPLLSQIAIHLQNVLGAKTDEHQGQQADILMGHSFGEIAAFEIAGCFDLLTGVQIVCERVRAISQHAPADGDLLVVSDNRYRVATELPFSGANQVVIAGRNHDRQTVLSGPRDQLQKLSGYFRQRDVPCVPVPTPTSFHHPRLRQAAQQWSQRMRELNLKGPDRPLYSPNGRKFIGSTDDIAATLSQQLLRPFDLKGAVDDLIAFGATHFVDCGSTGSLAKLLARSGANVRQMSTHSPPVKQPKLNGFQNRIAAALTNGQINSPAGVNGLGVQTKDQPQPRSQNSRSTPIAIVGQGCLLPGEVNSPEQLYRAISDQRNGIVDQRQFDADWAEDFYSAELQPDRSTSFLTGRVSDAQIVCPNGIDPDVFANFSRTQRLLCISLAPCLESLRDAKRIMCFVGATADGFEDHDLVTSLEYAGIDPCAAEVDRVLHTRTSIGRGPHAALQEVIDVMVGPGVELMMVDAACASSLYAAALGMQALETGRADAVIAGGVFCPGPGNSCLFSQFHGTTATGCRPFDASSDGVVFSEGAAVVTLRRLEDAVRLNCPVTGLLRGFGLSSDGRSSSANVPQTEGQLLSLERCYSNYGLDLGSIDAIEAHGTSTPVGDATELRTLARFFGNRVNHDIPVHSLKGLLGHAGWAAGTASLIAACQYLQRGVFPAQANFQNPCDALLDSDAPLTVSTTARQLPSRARVAVDGFGFGGANAHMVVEKYQDSLTVEELTVPDLHPQLDSADAQHQEDDELVIVACHQLEPEQGNRFERNHKLSDRHVLLPDLFDDMDISQGLAVSLADGILANLPDLNAEVREATGMVLALSGKTERGIEATARILTPRLKRILHGEGDLIEKLDSVMDHSRPSGPYTLQCMMPNVASGRAALQLDLKGPNFVVDAGNHSLEAAFNSASLLVGKRNRQDQLCIVATIQANGGVDEITGQDGEYAAAFLVTTRRSAKALGLEALSTLDQIQNTLGSQEQSMASQVRQVMQMLGRGDRQPAQQVIVPQALAESNQRSADEFATHSIHTPVWVESETDNHLSDQPAFPSRLVVVLADARHADPWIEELTRRGTAFKLIIAGRTADLRPPAGGSTYVINWNDPQSIQSCLDEVAAFEAEVVIGFDSPLSWELESTLVNVANHPIGEMMFLLAQRLESRARQGKVDFWGLFLDSFCEIEHPMTGATAGVLKSLRRELNLRKGGVIYTRGLTLPAALDQLVSERGRLSREAEVAFDGASRWIRRLQPVSSKGPARAERLLNQDSVVVATGGAQGVTAVLMESLLKKYQCNVVAIGRSKPAAGPVGQGNHEGAFYEDYIRRNPNADGAEMKRAYQRARRGWETHSTIERLQSLSGHFEYLAADVTDPNQVDRAIHQIVSRFGKIDLLVHGAGIQLSKQLKDRSLAEFQKTFAVKVGGLRNLVEYSHRALGHIPSVHALTSAYSIFGNDGQHDYGAANETLDRLCNLGSAQQHAWNSIAWLAWDGIGMTRGSEYQALAEQRGLSALTPETGAPFFHQVLEGESSAAINVPLSDQERLTYEVETVPASSSSADRILESRFDLNEIQWLHHHRVREVPTVPGAWLLDKMVQAAAKVAPKSELTRAVTAEDIAFRRFVRVLENGATPRVVAIQQADEVEAWILADLRHPSGTLLKKDVVLAQARFHFHDGIDRIPELKTRPVRSSDADQLRDPYCSSGNSPVQLSGPFDCLQDIQIGNLGRQARFTLPACCDNPGTTHTPALLLDATWRTGAMYAQPHNCDLFVPVQIKRITMPFGAGNWLEQLNDCTILSTPPQVDQECAYWSRSEVRDSSGRLQIVVENATAKRMS